MGPLVSALVAKGWGLAEIIFGRSEWRVPVRPSEATRREKGCDFVGFPSDIAIFVPKAGRSATLPIGAAVVESGHPPNARREATFAL